MYKILKPYTLARFKPTVFYIVGGDDDHYIHPFITAIENIICWEYQLLFLSKNRHVFTHL
jgi:hypothetical protein